MNDADDSGWEPIFLPAHAADLLHEHIDTIKRLTLYLISPNENERAVAELIRRLNLPWHDVKILLSLKEPTLKRGNKSREFETDWATAILRERLGREPTVAEIVEAINKPNRESANTARTVRRHRSRTQKTKQ